MPKLNETFAKKVPHSSAGTEKHWDTEVRGLVLFVGKRSKTWYFQKDVGGQTRRVLIGRYPTISAEAARQSPCPPPKAQIDRINELSALARTAWFSLLGYLVFVGITLLGVKDADFFVPSRQTELPLVNVAIPTASFFWTAPILGAALYTYLRGVMEGANLKRAPNGGRIIETD